MDRRQFPALGCGIGLRRQHYEALLATHPAIDWLEIISENFMVPGGRPLAVLESVRTCYPIVCHGVSLSIGSSDPLDQAYLKQPKDLARRFHPAWISDHLCWTGAGGHNLHALLPLPYHGQVVAHVARRVREVQDILQQPIALENISSYLSWRSSELEEWDFVRAVAEEADCAILLDINNIYVNAFNHGFDPHRYIDAIPAERVIQYHLAGHSNFGSYLLDSPDQPICATVWELYDYAVARLGPLPTLIEWDDKLPTLEELIRVANHARSRQSSPFAELATIQAR